MTDVASLLLVAGQIVESAPEWLQEAAGALPSTSSPLGLVIYGAWVLFGGAMLKRLYRRYRSRGAGPAPTVNQGSSNVQANVGVVASAAPKDEKAHVAFKLPSSVPVSDGVREVTHNEVHAIEIGIVVGLVTAWLVSVGRQNAAVGIVVAFVAGALGLQRYRTKAFKTVRMEPWYALLSFVIGAGVGLAIIAPDALVALSPV